MPRARVRAWGLVTPHHHPRLSSVSLWPWAASLPGMWERTLTIGSAGKSFSATGWKVSRRGLGYHRGTASPHDPGQARLHWELGKGVARPQRASPPPCIPGPGGLGPGPGQSHEAPAYRPPEHYLSLSHAGPGEERQGIRPRGERHHRARANLPPSPVRLARPILAHPPQAAVAQSFQHEQLHFGQPSSYFVQLPQAVQRYRDHMIRSLQSVGLKPVVPQGSYFLIADISDFSEQDWPGRAEAGWEGGGWRQLGLSVASVLPETQMPDLPGDADEPYDRRFVKWMIRNKVGWARPGSCGRY